jgi:transcriptional regulator with XRE-family HTH domain
VPPTSQFATELSDALRHVLREAREAADMSLGEAALRSGLNRQAIAFIERGERRPTTDTFSRLSIALGIRPSEAWSRAEARLSGRIWREAFAKAKPVPKVPK